MEAAGYSPSARQTLTMFINGLPMNIVSYITLYDNVLISLNDPNDSLLPNIHYLFDHVTSVVRSRLLHHDQCSQQINNLPVAVLSSTTTLTQTTLDGTGNVCKCTNCNWLGHTDDTCFQLGGKMEGCREEYLAS
jgi:hypothetical protein